MRIYSSLDSIFADVVDVTEFTSDSGTEVSTGAMVALLPAQEYKDLLVIPGQEPPDELHVTLLYLGKAVNWEENASVDKEQLIEAIQHIFSGIPEIHAEINSHAVFNPGGDEPASVYLIGGEGAVTCRTLHELISQEVNSDHYSVEVPNDFPFYIPHITIGYNFDVSQLTYQGPITFDTVRIVFGGDTTDIPLRRS